MATVNASNMVSLIFGVEILSWKRMTESLSICSSSVDSSGHCKGSLAFLNSSAQTATSKLSQIDLKTEAPTSPISLRKFQLRK